MKFKINYKGNHSDSLIVEGITIEKCRGEALSAIDSKGWEWQNCFSEKIED